MKKTLRYIAFALFLLVLLLPALQQRLGLVKEKPLNGAFIPAEMPVFTWKYWFSGEFQGKFDRFLEDHIGFRNSLVRVKNQLDYSLFREPNAEGVVVGKDDFLFEYDYIKDYTGKDFVGMEFIRKKMLRAKFVQDYLKDSLNIDFTIIFEPGKASFFPEYIPDRYLRHKSEWTNYTAYASLCDELGIKHIDLNSYFLQLKSTLPYPLFPKYGTHWSLYSIPFVMDTLVKYIEEERGIEMRSISVDNFEVDEKARASDNDVELPLNLICALPAETYAYPVWNIDSTSEKSRPMVLTISDSYYWMIFNSRLPKHLYANEAFWYYNSKVYPDTYIQPTFVKDLDFRKEIEQQDVILVMVTERFMHKFDWQFIDMAYDLYTPDWLYDPVYNNMNRIVLYEPWFSKVIDRSVQEGKTIGDILIDEARFLYLTEDRPSYLIDFGVENYETVIRNDDSWYQDINRKAAEAGISVSEQLRLDALYIFQLNEPDLYEIHQGIAALAQEMESRLESLDSLAQEASVWGYPLEDYTWKKARRIYYEQELQKTESAIRSTPDWLESVRIKALEKNIPLDSMIRIDAEYVWEQRLRSSSQ